MSCVCGSENVTVSWQTFKNGTKHLRAHCESCNTVSFLKKTPENILLTDDANKDASKVFDEPAKYTSSQLLSSLLMIFPHEMDSERITIKKLPDRDGSVGSQLVYEMDKLIGLETD